MPPSYTQSSTNHTQSVDTYTQAHPAGQFTAATWGAQEASGRLCTSQGAGDSSASEPPWPARAGPRLTYVPDRVGLGLVQKPDRIGSGQFVSGRDGARSGVETPFGSGLVTRLACGSRPTMAMLMLGRPRSRSSRAGGRLSVSTGRTRVAVKGPASANTHSYPLSTRSHPRRCGRC